MDHTRLILTLMTIAALTAACRASEDGELEAASISTATYGDAPAGDRAALVARGEALIDRGLCNDCHTPVKMGPRGPEPDLARKLSGHPDSLVMPPAPALPPDSPWVAVASATMTAWNGPWGTSFTANLTPDAETGLGTWTTADFIAAIRTGRHMGKGRPILPPMPVVPINESYTDEDLTAMFAYLQTLPAVENRVPQPIEPAPAAQPERRAALGPTR